MKLTSFVLFLSFLTAAKAEYRVFILEITNTKQNTTRTIKSTLDPLQYQSIYPLAPNESITYTDTWRCRGNTAFLTTLCNKPWVKN